MVIKADEQGSKAIQELCDLALKFKGIEVISGVYQVLGNIQGIEAEKEKESK